MVHIAQPAPGPAVNLHQVGVRPVVIPAREEEVCLIHPCRAGVLRSVGHYEAVVEVALPVDGGVGEPDPAVAASHDVPGVVPDHVDRAVPVTRRDSYVGQVFTDYNFVQLLNRLIVMKVYVYTFF